MITQELVDFIKKEVASGKTHDQVRDELIAGDNWENKDVEDAFKSLNTSSFSKEDVVPQKSEEPAYRHKKKSKLGLVTSIIIVLAILASGAYAYFSGVFASFEQITSRAFDAAVQADSAYFDTTFTIDLTDLRSDDGDSLLSAENILLDKISITNKGRYDKSDSENTLFENTLFFEHKTTNGSIDFKVTDGTLYAKLVKAPTIQFISVLEQFEGKWFSFPIKNEDTNNMASLPLTGLLGFNTKELQELNADQKREIYDIVRNAKLIRVTQKFAPEIIAGTLSYHFEFELNRAGIMSFLEDLKSYVHAVGKDSSRLSSFDPELFNQELDKIEDFTGEMWIGRSDHLLRKVQFNFSILHDYRDLEEPRTYIGAVGVFDNWNEPISVEVPEEVVDFKTFAENELSRPNNLQTGSVEPELVF